MFFRKGCTLLVCILIGLYNSYAQPFSKKYIMAFHSCDASQCNGPQDHSVQLAESNDGTNWTLVPNFTSYSGSVPEVIIRNNKLYLYTPGKVKRYDYNSNAWDSGTTNVQIIDSANNKINFVDPSAILDSSGNLVLVFLNSTGLTGDPAQCNPYPCTKYFDSAVEKPGTDGTEFIMQSGHRYSITLSSGTASDPDVYFDGSKYIMYISRGSSTYAYYASSLHGSYQVFSNLNNGLLTNNGGIPCGYYDTLSQQYWTYVHASSGSTTEIKQGIHSDFNSTIASLNTIISGTLMGLGTNYKTESPAFTENTFDSTTSIYKMYPSNLIEVIYRNTEKIVDIRNLADTKCIEIYNIVGKKIHVEAVHEPSVLISTYYFSPGLYFIQAISSTEKRVVGKFVK